MFREKKWNKSAPSEWEISFADGNNNHYSLKVLASDSSCLLEYTPVTASESSSGIYSGVKPLKVNLSLETGERIRSQVHDLFAKKELHSQSRMMMTGLFILKEKAGELRFICSNCLELREFTNFLGNLSAK